MLQYVCIGFIFSGLMTLEATLRLLPQMGPWIPDLGLLLVVVYGLRTEGKAIAGVSLCLGWVKGCAEGHPAGVYILTYLFAGLFLKSVRGIFFTERVFTQLALMLIAFVIAESIKILCIQWGVIPDQPNLLDSRGFLSAISTVLAVPLFVFCYNRMKPFNELIQP